MIRISKPSLRKYVKVEEIPRVKNGLGMAVVSTPKGIMTGQKAKKLGAGGEVLCIVW
jgi:small subunit ribosomal protein S8